MRTFAGSSGHADVAVIIVTYNSAGDLPGLLESLRAQAADQSIRVVVADNSSSDGTMDLARSHNDVIAMETGGNLGYAGGINAAMTAVGSCDAVLILNPDLTVEPGAVRAMRDRMHESRAGIVVPVIHEPDGRTASLRFEPSTLRALGDALFGGRVQRRPSFLSEIDFAPASYEVPHRIEWATGAALLIDFAAAQAVGSWDEQFFLYSEETDFFRRMREAEYGVWFEPSARVRHSQGGSGTSLGLDRLLAVNRVRYYRKHHGPVASVAFRGVVVLHELLRSTSSRHRAVLGTVASERTWPTLPRASHSVEA